MNNVRFTALLLMLVSLWWFAPAEQAHALLDTHECSFCHNFHGGPGYSALLIAESSEIVCLTCHTVDINSTKSAEAHNPLGLASNQPGYITCRECHDAHDNQGGNAKMVGYRRDAQNWSSSFAIPGIRKELPSTVGLTYNVVTYTGPTDFNIAGSTIGACEACHDPYHNEGNDCTQCHSHSGGFPKPDCTAVGCHDGNGTGALAVGASSSHSTDTIFASTGVTFTCGDCHTSHGTAGNVLIPNNPAVGINYNSAGHGGISLGSSVATGSTEAEVCWNCHVDFTPVISEWGGNTGSGYDYGSLHSSSADGTASPGDHVNWTTGYWKSANFTYKNGPLNTRPVDGNGDPGNNSAGRGSASIHATGGTVGTPSDALADISCSYCHDVHELNLLASDSSSGKPYLRGSWTPNPFPEDGAPRSGVASYAGTDFGGVPRGGTDDGTGHPLTWSGNNKSGGWQIEQNNSAFSWTNYASGAGVCNNCHTAGSIEASISWTGHNVVVPGFGGSNGASNIFTTTKRGGNGTYLRGHMRHANTTAYNGTRVYGLRSTEAGNGQNPPVYGIVPVVNPKWPETGNLNLIGSTLGITVDSGTTDPNFHNFPCSKCHNPHASRLPRLMITNCLDVKNNSWDDTIDPTSWTPISGTNGHTATQLAYASSATNCHRYVSATDPNRETNGSNENGWNSATPW